MRKVSKVPSDPRVLKELPVRWVLQDQWARWAHQDRPGHQVQVDLPVKKAKSARRELLDRLVQVALRVHEATRARQALPDQLPYHFALSRGVIR